MTQVHYTRYNGPGPDHNTEHVSLPDSYRLSEPEGELAGEEAVEGDGEDEGHVGCSRDVDCVSGYEAECGAKDPPVVA